MTDVFAAHTRRESPRHEPVGADLAHAVRTNDLDAIQTVVREQGPQHTDRELLAQEVGNRYWRWSMNADKGILEDITQSFHLPDDHMTETVKPLFEQKFADVLVAQADTAEPLADKPLHDIAADVRRRALAHALHDWLQTDFGESHMLAMLDMAWSRTRVQGGLHAHDRTDKTASLLQKDDITDALKAYEMEWRRFGGESGVGLFAFEDILRLRLQQRYGTV